MEPLSDTESEPEQFPTEPVVEVQSLEKPKKRVYKKKVKVVEPVDVVEEAPAKPKRVMTEEHKEKMRLAREASKARKALTQSKPEPLTRQETEEPKAEPEVEVKPKRKYTRKPKAEVVEPVAEPKVVVKEIHHHYAEPKAKKATGEKAPRKPRVKKEVAEPKQIVQSVDFV
jgi:hypothetical protein